MKFKVNATGCGLGKTNSIIKSIKKNSNEKYLIIVPSVHLANEYASKLNTFSISTDSCNNVQSEISNRISDKILIITQKAFRDCAIKRTLCFQRNIIQDEEFSILSITKWVMNNHTEYLNMFSINSISKTWNLVNIDPVIIAKFISTEDIFDNKEYLKDLVSTPQQLYTNTKSVNELSNDSYLLSVLSPSMYEGASRVYIACANFTRTQQYILWKNLFKVDFDVVNSFVPYKDKKVIIHWAEQYRNSKTYNSKNDSIRKAFIDYVNLNRNNEDVIYVDNNSNRDIPNWVRLTHNCHGVNEFSEKAHIVIMSAINYNSFVINFFNEVVNISHEQIRYALIGELSHQISMRGILRKTNNNRVCHIYVMEQELAMYLYSLFDEAEQKNINGTKREKKALTNAQLIKLSGIRKNAISSEFNNMTNEQIMSHEVWRQTNARGIYTKKYINHLKSLLNEINGKELNKK